MLARIDPFERALGVTPRFWNRPLLGFKWNTADLPTAGFGAVDVAEDEEAITFTADLPGLDSENLTVEAENSVLTIKGERTIERNEEGKTYHRYERSVGTFSRGFRLPETVDTEKIEAKYKEGVLTVTVPKSPRAKPRKIEVEA